MSRRASRRLEPGRDTGPVRIRSNPLLAAARLCAICAATLCVFAGYLLHAGLSSRAARLAVAARWTRRWAGALRSLAGLQVRFEGSRPPAGSFLAPNHSGYVDVLAIGSLVDCFFVAKAEVARWPAVGTLFRSTHQIAVPREDLRGLAETIALTADRLRKAHSVCVFLEGTSSGNDRVLPFRPAMLQAAMEAGACAVPVGIRWAASRGGVDISEDVAYWKDHVFGPHAWRLLGLRGITAVVGFGEPISCHGRTRKELAAALEYEAARLSGLPRVTDDRPEMQRRSGPA